MPRNERTFTDTYCMNGFVPRVDTKLGNTTQGLKIRPTPVELYAKGFNGEDYQAAVVSKLNDLAYIRNVNPEEFKRVLETLSKSGKRLQELPGILDAWTQK
ncbi:hypothetical protein BZM27_42840 [Paraburkholderia steynii]|uniref:Uncharacterized protein n=1 Tax=Paraburkholderia steynii TaxID=1245441 RepID=A0A4R0X2V3_9BURK|nr:hypothetical protein BZM27_42840 [Paraburkholderia steynii]